MRRRAAAGAALLLVLAAAGPARANFPDELGLGARAGGMAGAQVADTSGWAALHHNPGAAAESPHIAAAVGYGGAAMLLKLDGRDAGVTSPRGVHIGLHVPVTFKKWAASFGVAVHLPDQFLLRIHLAPIDEPRFVLLDNGLSHLVVTTALSLKLGRWLGLGAGATILADAAGDGLTFDVGVVRGDKVGRAALDVSLPLRAAAVAGVLIKPTRWLRIGAAYRGQLDLGLRLDILANVDIAGTITGDTVISLRAVDFFTPHKATLGVAADPLPWLTLSAEVSWLAWSAFTGAVPDLRILVNLDITPPFVEARLPRARFDDIWVPRAGVEARRRLHPKLAGSLRAGYAYTPSPVPDQTGLTNFADCDRHTVALGGGLELSEWSRILPKPIKLDIALQVHQLEPRATVKDPRVVPGQGFVASGTLVYAGATLEARF